MILWMILVILVAGFDQFTKYWVVANIGGDEILTVVPNVVDFVHVKNTGAAFSILSDNIEILSIISSLFCIAVLIYMIHQRPKNKLLITAIALVFGGALGNVIDRIFRGFVVDFIEVTFINFPVFNVADIAITVGAALLIIYILFFDKKEVVSDAKDSNNSGSEG